MVSFLFFSYDVTIRTIVLYFVRTRHLSYFHPLLMVFTFPVVVSFRFAVYCVYIV